MQKFQQSRQGYRFEELGSRYLKLEIPSEWKMEKLSDLLLDIRGGAPLKPEHFTPRGFPVLHKGDIKTNDTLEIGKTNPFCSHRFAEDQKTSIIDDSFMVVTLRDLVPSGPAIGLIAHSNGTYLLAQGAYGFHYNEQKVDCKYLVHLSNSYFYRKYMQSISVGSTQIHIRTPEFLKVKLPFPPLKEQQKIASILSNVDELIQKTDQIIEQTQRLKKGLLQKIFSERLLSEPHQTFAIDEIKASAPNSISMGPFGSNIKTDNFVSSGVPVIRGVNLTKEPFNMDGFVFIKEEKADELRSANAFAGDIVFTHRGTLGQVGIIPNKTKYHRFVISQSQMKLTCDSNKAFPMYVYYFFKSAKGQNALLSNISGTGVPAIGQPTTTLRKIRIPLPSLLEQQKRVAIFSKLEDLVQNRQDYKLRIEILKNGLMQKLLTGQIRVKL